MSIELVRAAALACAFTLTSATAAQSAATANAPVKILSANTGTLNQLAATADGSLIYADEKHDVIVQRSPNGKTETLLDHVKNPRAIAWGADGTLFVAVDQIQQGAQSLNGALLKRVSGQWVIFASGFSGVQQLYYDSSTQHLLLTTSAPGKPRSQSGTSLPVPANPPGYDGCVFELDIKGEMVSVTSGFNAPAGVWREPGKALLVSATDYQTTGPRLSGSLFRRDSSGTVSLVLASRLTHPRGVVQDP